jgi:hypothetical protein
MTATDLSDWRGVPRPVYAVLDGRHAGLGPLDPARHGDALHEVVSGEEATRLHRCLADPIPSSAAIGSIAARIGPEGSRSPAGPCANDQFVVTRTGATLAAGAAREWRR